MNFKEREDTAARGVSLSTPQLLGVVLAETAVNRT